MQSAQLLVGLEQVTIYRSPAEDAAQSVYDTQQISREEYDMIVAADRRFMAAQVAEEGNMTQNYPPVIEGYLLKKGGGTSTFGRWAYKFYYFLRMLSSPPFFFRRNWHRRWCSLRNRVLYVYTSKPETVKNATVKTSIALVVLLVINFIF